jgi:hypothetical protein
MNMRARLLASAGLLLLSLLTVGCDSDEQVHASCSLSASITFENREYTAVESLPGLGRRKVRIGERLGSGELGTCPGQPERRVEVYKVVGVPVERAVFSEPEYGLMRGLEPGEAIE